MDDMVSLASNDYMIKYTKKIFTNKFNMKDLSVTNIIPYIKISRKFDGLVLSQCYYVGKILIKFCIDDNSIVKILVDLSYIYLKIKVREHTN